LHRRNDAKVGPFERTYVAGDTDDPVYGSKCRAGFVIETPPFSGGNQATLLPPKQVKPQFLFKVADEAADRWLGRVQLFGGGGDGLAFVDCGKGL
jgi:hypothetical protein